MSEIIGILGLQGEGKTTLSTYIATQKHKQGKKIYCNYALKKIPFTPIGSLEDIAKVRHGVLILDEIWLWIFSRTSMSKINQEIMKIIMLNRKRGVDIVYTAQLERTVDVILREVTTVFLFPHIVSRTYNEGEETEHTINTVRWHEKDLKGRRSKFNFIPHDLAYMGSFFDTNEEIEKLKKELTPLEKGIGLEKDFDKVLKKSKEIMFTNLQDNSGNKSDYKFDILAIGWTDNYAFDVKSTGEKSDYVSISEYGEDFENKIKSISRGNKLMFKPYYAFPVKENKYTTRVYDWYICPLDDNYEYFKRKNSPPRYTALIKKSTLLSKSILFNKTKRGKH